MSAFKYQWNQTIDVGTAGLSKQWTSIRHILSLLVTANACVHVTAYVAVRRSLSTTYTAVVLGLLLRQYVSYQFGVWAVIWHPVPLARCHWKTPHHTFGMRNIEPDTTLNTADVRNKTAHFQRSHIVDKFVYVLILGKKGYRLWANGILQLYQQPMLSVRRGVKMKHNGDKIRCYVCDKQAKYFRK